MYERGTSNRNKKYAAILRLVLKINIVRMKCANFTRVKIAPQLSNVRFHLQ